MEPATTAGLIAAGSNLLAGGIGAVSNGKLNKLGMKNSQMQREWSEQMMNKQNAWSTDMWNATNAYNDPSAIRKRLLNAGINPLSQDLTGNGASTIQSADAQPFTMPNLVNPFEVLSNNISNVGLQAAQIANINAQTDKTIADTQTTNDLRPSQIRQAEEQAIKLHSENDQLLQNIENLKSQKNLTDSQKSYYDKLTQGVELSNKWIDAEKQMTLNAHEANISVQRVLKDKSEHEASILRYQLENLLPLDRLQKLADIDYTKENTNLIKKNINKVAYEIDNIVAHTDQIIQSTHLTELDILAYAFNHYSQTHKTFYGVIDQIFKGLSKPDFKPDPLVIEAYDDLLDVMNSLNIPMSSNSTGGSR